MKKNWLAAVVLAGTLGGLAAEQGQWIWYPGDYALWRGNDLQAKRIEFGGGYPVFWASYAAHPLVDFKKVVDLKQPEVADIAYEGVCRITGVPGQAGVVSNKFVFPAGRYEINARVYSQGKPPAFYLNGPTVKTDSSWVADWRGQGSGLGGLPMLPAETRPAFNSPARVPSEFKLVTEPAEPVSLKTIRGNHLLADFGHETFGYLKLQGVRGAGEVKIVYGESEPEALCENEGNDGPDQWEIVEVAAQEEVRLPVSRGFRYVQIIPRGDVTLTRVAMDVEKCPLARAGRFRCSDEQLNKIWNVSADTLELTTHELFVEAAKRDRWTWSGDARQSYFMSYYLFANQDLCKDSLFYQRGGDPVAMHLNQIMDYTFYWFLSVREYYQYTGDKLFLQQVYDRMVSLMDFALVRLDGKGRPHNAEGDWMFIDWAPEALHNHGGVTSFEQMLLVESLGALDAVAKEIGRPTKEDYAARAAKLRAEIVPLWWNKEKGGLMHLLKDDGTWDPQFTRYPNMFGLQWGYFDKEQRMSVLKNVIFNDAVMKIQTPYMRYYELEALCRLGLQEGVLQEMKRYWGGMLAEGATSFWELYNPDEKGAAKYAMYGRPYGKSLCHAWGASPLYLLGRFYLGVEPTKPGYAAYTVKPVLAGLDWMEGEVPTPHGNVKVSVHGAKLTVTAPAQGEGTVDWRGQTQKLAPGATLTME